MHKAFIIQGRSLQKLFTSAGKLSSGGALCLKQSSSWPAVTYGKSISLRNFLSANQVLPQDFEKRKCLLKAATAHNSIRNKSNAGDQSSESSIQDENVSGDSTSKKKKDYNFDAFGTWDNRIDLPLMMEASIKQGAPIPLIVASDVGCSSIVGKRTYQEDRYVVIDLPGNILCAAVFDGHGGSECSEFCQQNLESILKENLSAHKDLEAVLHHGFLKLHSQYVAWTEKHSAGLKAGTTATVCLLRNGVELAVGHVGDSRAILCRSGAPRELAHDHCPSLKSEKVRILQSGGRVSVDNIGRHMVNETLSMSRSIGDIHLKSYGVIALPDTRTMRIKHGKDAFLLLITDGVNFVLRNEEVCNIVNQAEDPYLAAQLLTEQALSLASEDNMTALVIPFGSWGKYTKSASMFFSFGIGRDMNKSSRFG